MTEGNGQVKTPQDPVVGLAVQFQNLLGQLQNMRVQITQLSNQVRDLEKNWQRQVRNLNKDRKGRNMGGKKRAPSGFAKPALLSKELCRFLNKPEGTEMARTEVTKHLTQYIKSNELQDTEDKRKIHPDQQLSKLLMVNKEDDVTYFNLQKWMKPHFQATTAASQ